jgi:tetratricopeptide (TPR) repeat protein
MKLGIFFLFFLFNISNLYANSPNLIIDEILEEIEIKNSSYNKSLIENSIEKISIFEASENNLDQSKIKLSRSLNQEGLDQFKSGHYQKAIEIFNDAVEENKSDPEILNNLAASYIENRTEYSKAKDLLVSSILLKPSRVYSWMDLARLYALMGDEDKSIKSYIVSYVLSKNKNKFKKSLNIDLDSSSIQIRSSANNMINILNRVDDKPNENLIVNEDNKENQFKTNSSEKSEIVASHPLSAEEITRAENIRNTFSLLQVVVLLAIIFFLPFKTFIEYLLLPLKIIFLPFKIIGFILGGLSGGIEGSQNSEVSNTKESAGNLFEFCVTCQHWTGSREVDSSRTLVYFDRGARGKCYADPSKISMDTDARSGCSSFGSYGKNYQKFRALR